MFRFTLSKITDPETGAPVFSLFALIFFSVVLTERDAFNNLELDEEFCSRFYQVHYLPDKMMDEFYYECQIRMKIRLELATLCLVEQQVSQNFGEDFNIVDMKVYNECRFSQITRTIIECFEVDSKRDLFIKRFDTYQDQCLTYKEFFNLV